MKKAWAMALVCAGFLGAGLAARGEEEPVPPVVAKLRAIAQRQTIAPQTSRYLLVLNGQELLAEAEMQAVHKAAAADLRVPVRLETVAAGKAPGDVAAAAAWPADTNCAACVALVRRGAAAPALTLAPDSRRALVNVDALAAGKLGERVRRHINRAFGFLFGTGFTQGPGEPDAMAPVFKEAAELDKALAGFEAVAAQRFLAGAQAFGLEPVTELGYRQLTVRGVMPPINPRLWPTWEKRHKKSVAAAFKAFGLDPEATMAELRKLAETRTLEE